MAVDNPSYFSLSSGTGGSSSSSSSTTPTTSTPVHLAAVLPGRTHQHAGIGGFSALFRRKAACKMGATASSSSSVSASTSSTLMHHQEGHRSSGASAPSTPTEECVPMLPRSGTIHCGSGSFPSGHGNNQRRSFRNLFRSISANSEPLNDARTQQFLKGDPRPSDVAPPSPYLPHRSHSHSENDRTRCRRGRRILKSASELLSNDMVYCGLSGNGNVHADENEGETVNDCTEEVFLGLDDARYYNLSSTIPLEGSAAAGRRRHSTGTFLSTDRNVATNFGKKQLQIVLGLVESQTSALVAPSVDVVDGLGRHDNKKERSSNKSKRRRHKSMSSKGSHPAIVQGTVEDDVVFLSSKESEASSLWVNYLTACFEQISRQQGRPPYKVRHVTIEEPILPGMEARIKLARLQIVIVCPVFLEGVTSQSDNAMNLSRNFMSDRVLAMMLGVHEGQVTESHRSILLPYNQWRKFFVKDQDETFVGDFLGAAVRILGAAPPSTLKSGKTVFSVHPKKVKLGQTRIIALLNDPLRPEDNVSVIVDRCGDAIDIIHIKRRNPYTLQFSIPEKCLEVSMLVGVRICKNGCPLGVRQIKCESRLRELDQILRAYDNPLEFMCQTFGFNLGDRDQLDNWMVHAFQRNVPHDFSLLSTPSGVVHSHKNHTSPEENPTLLHFAARFGLERLAWQLLECPGGDLACDLRNVCELTPADLAEQAGHAKLAHQLRGYMQMNEFTNMYSYLKGISETTSNAPTGTDLPSGTTNDTVNDREDYCRPRPLSEAYSVPPAARPITSLILPPKLTAAPNAVTYNLMEANYAIVPVPTPIAVTFPTTTSTSTTTTSTNANDLGLPHQGYMIMEPAAGPTKSSPSNVASQQATRTGTLSQMNRIDQHSYATGMKEEDLGNQVACIYGRSTSSTNSTRSREPSGPQDELLEIISDFKNNVFTISEVERLVENWRNRNDVQQSFKDKQRQLTAMREEYERIQKRMKEEMKAPTPFDRIRKFFSKGKKADAKESSSGNDESSSSSTTKPDNLNSALGDHRPVSSLSLRSVSSSSSSGRMSTASGCSGTSLGDSGTHSDPEDRRLQNLTEDKPGVMPYEIPPAPKPFTGRHSPSLKYTTCLHRSSIENDLDLRRTHHTPRHENSENYIAFPPSGLPIHSFKPDGSLRESRLSSSPAEYTRYMDMLESSSAISSENAEGRSEERRANGHANMVAVPDNAIPTPPLGMRIPADYINVIPASPVSPLVFQESRELAEEGLKIDCALRCRNVDEQLAQPSVVNVDVFEVSRPTEQTSKLEEIAMGEDVVDDTRDKSNGGGYVEADTMDGRTKNNSSNDVYLDTSSLPEYMNIGRNSEQNIVKIVGSLPKKMPAPPVPPRVVIKK